MILKQMDDALTEMRALLAAGCRIRELDQRDVLLRPCRAEASDANHRHLVQHQRPVPLAGAAAPAHSLPFQPKSACSRGATGAE